MGLKDHPSRSSSNWRTGVERQPGFLQCRGGREGSHAALGVWFHREN